MPHQFTHTVTSLKILLCLTVFAVGVEGAANDQQIAHFEKQIRPVLASDCLKCHGAKKQEGGLRLDSLAAIQKGGDSGPAIVPGKPAESLLLEAIRYESFEMPPKKPLANSVISHFETWIAAGAAWPEALHTIRPAAARITDEDRAWWSFQPVAKTEPAVSPKDNWSQTPIDHFVWNRLTENGMSPAPKANKEILVRRLYYNVLGLPPTPEEINSFITDESEDAWEKLIDTLLADSRHGEHWARHWLDVVRYSESDGWNKDSFRPHAWLYRDYVINAMNSDKPYPQFVREQLAGDEIPGDDPDYMAATGFMRLGIYEYNQRDARSHWNDIMNEMTDVAGDVFFGMSMGCCRCHDHKFDPLLQKDYFALRAFFEPVIWRDDIPAATDADVAKYEADLKKWKEASKPLQTKIEELVEPYNVRKWESTVEKFPLEIQDCFHTPIAKRTSWDHQMAYLISRQFSEEGTAALAKMSKKDKATHKTLLKELAAFDKLKPSPLQKVMTVADFSGTIAPTVIPDNDEKAHVAPSFLTVMSTALSSQPPTIESSPDAPSTGRRTALAEWIGRPDNPLTTRVIVNRIWQQHFSQGLVETSNDFGRNGQPPSHPKLLDWLTATFVEDGWSFKKLHKRILLSAVWTQSTDHPNAHRYEEIDTADNLLWRAPVRRLKAEQIRDAMLSASGEIKHQLGGPSVKADPARRSIYLQSFRNKTETFLHAFDVANGLKSVSVRDTTTTPTQSLLLINGKYTIGRSRKLAARLRKESGNDASAIVSRATKLTWGRAPTTPELEASIAFLQTPAAADTLPKLNQKRLVDYCHVLLNSNEFLYLR